MKSIEATKLSCRDDIVVTMRPMTLDDYNEVLKLLPTKSSFLPFTLEVSTCNAVHSADTVRGMLAIPTFHPFCAYRDDELVGYCELHRQPHLGRSYDGRIERVVVKESFRGKGLASAMCEYLINQAEATLNCNRIDLTVEAQDARHIYEKKLGFSPVTTTVLRLRLPRK